MTQKRGRPTKFSPETRKILLTALSSGAQIKDACAMAGITAQTLSAWRQIGEAHQRGETCPGMPQKLADRAEYSEFVEALKKARSTAQFRGVTNIQLFGQDCWTHEQTGRTRTSAPPPITYMHRQTGELVYSLQEATQLDNLENWQRQWSGEAWQVKRGDWRAVAWYLERSNPKAWAKRTRSDAQVADWRKEAEAAGLSPAEINDIFEQLVQRLVDRIEGEQEKDNAA